MTNFRSYRSLRSSKIAIIRDGVANTEAALGVPERTLTRPVMLSYAQNGEDVVLSRVFADREAGFYVDIGACHPVEDSVTCHFYNGGWSGVNVEPDRDLYGELAQARPRDTNLCVAIGRVRGRTKFHPTGTRGHGTLDATLASVRRAGRPAERVPTMLLSDVIDCHGPDGDVIDFLKVDVEGWETEVIASCDWTKHRPRVLVIEAVDDKGRATHEAWEPYLLDANYRFAMFDGLNRFYCREEDAELLMPRLSAPANVLDGWIRAGDARAHATAARLQDELGVASRQAAEAEERADAKFAAMEQQAAEAEERASTQLTIMAQQAAEAEYRLNALGMDLNEARDVARAAKTRAEAAMLEAEQCRCEAATARARSDAMAIDAARARAEAAASLRREEAAEALLAASELDLIRGDGGMQALRTAERRADEAEAWLAAVRASTSWRVTRPFRVCGRLLLRGLRVRS